MAGPYPRYKVVATHPEQEDSAHFQLVEPVGSSPATVTASCLGKRGSEDHADNGPCKQPAGLLEALKAVTKRVLSSPKGDFIPSPPPRLLDRLTDADLASAWTAVEAVAAEMQPKPSGSAQKRALAWTVADARGAVRALEKTVADRVGLRLQAQALKVRSRLAAADAHAESERERVRSEASAEPSDEHSADSALSSKLAEVDSELQRAHQAARDEEYVGFNELQDVLASEDSHTPRTYMADTPPLEESDIPLSLAEKLTKEDADSLRTFDYLTSSDLQPDELPYVISRLLTEVSCARSSKELYLRLLQESKKEQELLKAECQEAVAEAKRESEAKCEEAQEENERLEQELREVRGQLAWAKGGIAALNKVIDEKLAKHMPVDK